MSTEEEKTTLAKELLTFTDRDDRNIHKKLDNEIPQEIKFQITNVLSVIKTAIETLKICLILPTIFENPKVLHLHLKNTKYEEGLRLVEAYRRKRTHESLADPDVSDYDLLKVIEYFQQHYKMMEFLPNWLGDIDETEKKLIKAFRDLYLIAKQRINRPATTDLAKEKRLHEVYLLNEKVKKEINAALHRLKNKKLNRLWKYAAKSGIIKKLEDEFAFHQYDNNVFVNNEIIKSNQEIRKIHYYSIAKQREVEEEVEKARIIYEKKLKADLLLEKSGQDEMNKLQLQLKALIDKYDSSLLEKYKEELILQNEYENRKKELDELLITYSKERTVYEEVVVKRLQADKRLHDAKVLLFTRNRAAIKIQRWWRGYLKAKKKKQKKQTQGKKGQGKEEAPKGAKEAKGAKAVKAMKGAKGEKVKMPPPAKEAKGKAKAKK